MWLLDFYKTLFFCIVEIQAEKFLVYVSGKQGEVRGISLNMSGQGDVMVPIQSVQRPVALATHSAKRTIYFSDADRKKIVRKKIDRSNEQIEDVIIKGMYCILLQVLYI